MQIQLDDKTKQWLHSKAKPVSIKALQVHGCCAPPIQDVIIHLRKPKNLSNYTEVKIEGLSIFVEKQLSQSEKLTLKLTGIGMFKMLSGKLG